MRFDLIIVACSKTKTASPSLARELYTSDLFRKSRDFAELVGDDLLIASAKYGLLSPLETVEPYDQPFASLDSAGRADFRQRSQLVLGEWLGEWREQIAKSRDAFPTVAILAGKPYVDQLVAATWLKRPECRLSDLLEEMQIGQRLAWLKGALADARQLVAEAKEVF